MTKVKGFGFTGIATLAFLFAFQGAVHGQAKQKATKSAAKAAADKSTPQPPPDAQYLGSETCKTCHEDVYNSWEKTPHWKTTLDTKGGPSHQGCEGCHGPGIGSRGRRRRRHQNIHFQGCTRPRRSTDRCLTCHAGGTEHMNALNSEHTKNDVSCISCHSPHHAETRSICWSKPSPSFATAAICKKSRIRDALPSPRQRRADPVQRLPQSCTERSGPNRCAWLRRRTQSASSATPTSRGRSSTSMRR